MSKLPRIVVLLTQPINYIRNIMKQHIYKSEFITGPETTLRQDRLFNADLKYAIDQGYNYISMSDGKVFSIDVEDNSLTEVDLTEEELQIFAQIHADLKQAIEEELAEDEDTKDEEDYSLDSHNLMMIDKIINNTLRVEEPLTPQQADTLIKLAQLKTLLVNIH